MHEVLVTQERCIEQNQLKVPLDARLVTRLLVMP